MKLYILRHDEICPGNRCPKCESKRIAPIMYEKPLFNEKLQDDLVKQKVVLGGCIVSKYNPKMHCFECASNIAYPPFLLSDDGKETEAYRDIVTSVHFRYGSDHVP